MSHPHLTNSDSLLLEEDRLKLFVVVAVVIAHECDVLGVVQGPALAAAAGASRRRRQQLRVARPRVAFLDQRLARAAAKALVVVNDLGGVHVVVGGALDLPAAAGRRVRGARRHLLLLAEAPPGHHQFDFLTALQQITSKNSFFEPKNICFRCYKFICFATLMY